MTLHQISIRPRMSLEKYVTIFELQIHVRGKAKLRRLAAVVLMWPGHKTVIMMGKKILKYTFTNLGLVL